MYLSKLQKKVLVLMSDGKFHSGNEIAEKLGTSRAVVWNQVKGLSRLGIDMNAVTGRGYRIQRAVELLDSEKIRGGLSSHALQYLSDLEIHDEIDSTNSYLMDQVGGFSNATVCLAESQSAGKGRTGRKWISPFAANIYMSVLWHFQCGVAAIAGLSLAMGVAVIRALQPYSITGLGLKWPNDVLRRDQKLAGILVEVSGDTHGPCKAVIGFGLNWRMPAHVGSSIDQKWTDMESIMGSARPQRNVLVPQLLNSVLPIIANYDKNGLAPYLDEWRKSDCMTNKEVCLYLGGHQINGRVEGIDNEGMIVMQTDSQGLRRFASGEVSFRHVVS